MKVKVRGLVFVGFAAAVFAQSAFATITPNENEKKVVTSKYYVDTTFQEEEDKVASTPTGDGADAIWASSVKYPSMAVLKDVKDSVAGIHGDTNYIAVTEDVNGKQVGIITNNLGTTGDITAGTNTGRLATVGAVNGLLDTGISGTETNNTVPTSLAVQTYAEATANKLAAGETAGGTIGTNQTDDTKFPTVKNVYEFVTNQGANKQRKLGSTETGLYVGTYSATDADTWKALETAAAANSQASTDYVTIMDNGSGVYQVNIPAAQIADSVATDSSQKLVTENAVYDLVDRETTNGTTTITASASSTTVPTSKNVYDFVNGNYQPKTTATTVQTGYNGTWHTLGGDSYITVADNGTASSVTLGNFAAAADLYASENTNDGKLVTAGLVRNMRNTTLAATGETDQTIPTSKAVVDYVNGQFALGDNPCNESTTAGHYCALVAHYDANAGGQNVPGVVYEWTVMAPQN